MTTQLEQFRQQLYESFPGRADALMDLLDALSSNTTARSVVELCLHPLFRQGYGSVYTAIHSLCSESPPQSAGWDCGVNEQRQTRLIASYLSPPEQQEFWLFGLDVTPAPRPFAQTLEDRAFVHQPTLIKGNKPVAIGHQYSALVAFPEKGCRTDPPWVVPLSMRRVDSQQTATTEGANQMEALSPSWAGWLPMTTWSPSQDCEATAPSIARRSLNPFPVPRVIPPGMAIPSISRTPPPGAFQMSRQRPSGPPERGAPSRCISKPGTTCFCRASESILCIDTHSPYSDARSQMKMEGLCLCVLCGCW